MKISLPRFSVVFIGSEIFRIASLFLYITLLLHVGLVAYARQLVPTDIGFAVIGFLALLCSFSLLRYLRPNWFAGSQGMLLLELTGRTGVILLLTLQRSRSGMPLPWLIGIAGVFPLALRASPALVVVTLLAIFGSVFNLNLDLPSERWLPNVFATLFVGLLATLLSRALRMNLAAVHQARP